MTTPKPFVAGKFLSTLNAFHCGKVYEGESTTIKGKFSFFMEEDLRGACHASPQRLPPVWPRSMRGKGGRECVTPTSSACSVCAREQRARERCKGGPPAGCVKSGCRTPRRVIWVLLSLLRVWVWGKDIPLLVLHAPKNGGNAVGIGGGGHGHVVTCTAP